VLLPRHPVAGLNIHQIIGPRPVARRLGSWPPVPISRSEYAVRFEIGAAIGANAQLPRPVRGLSRSRILNTESRNDLFGKSGHLGFERLELQHEEFDASRVKFMDAASDGIVGADETGRCSPIGSDAR
jgi:hypothetical protein